MNNKIRRFFVIALLALIGCQGHHSPWENHDPIKDLSQDDFLDILHPASEIDSTSQPHEPVITPVTIPEVLEQKIDIFAEEGMSLLTVLTSLTEKAGLNLVIDPDIDGDVYYKAKETRLYHILKDICQMNHLKFSLENETLRIEHDVPYYQIYTLPFLSLERQTESATAANTSVMFGNSGLSENGSLNQIKGKAHNDFWQEFERNLQLILKESIATTEEENQTTATNSAPKDKNQRATQDYSLNKQAGLVTVRATEQQHQIIQSYIKQLEWSSGQQILLEAKIVEVNLNDEYRSGINWETLINRAVQVNAKLGNVAGRAAISSVANNSDMITIQAGDRGLKGVLNLIETFGTVRTLSSPRLTILNNQSALLKVADNQVFFQITVHQNEPYQTSQGKFVLPQTTFSSKVQTVPIGFIMTVQPAIDRRNNDIVLSLRPTITRISGMREDPAVKLMAKKSGVDVHSEIPIIATREIDSVLRLKSGQVAILGGLMQESSANLNGGIPGTAGTPFSAFTRGKSDDYQVVELVIFLKATILPTAMPHGSDKKLYEKFTNDPRPLWEKTKQSKGEVDEKAAAKNTPNEKSPQT